MFKKLDLVKYLNKTGSVSLFHRVKYPTVYPNLLSAYSFTFYEICENAKLVCLG